MGDELINYVRKHLNSGYSKQEIVRELLSNGWNSEQIEYAFQQSNESQGRHSKKFNWLWLILPIAILLISGIVFGLYYFSDSSKQGTSTNSGSQQIQGNTQQSSIIDCGTDIDCFIQSAESCQRAKLRFMVNVDLFGIEQTTTSDYEIKGIQSEKCVIYQKFITNDIRFSDALIQQMLGSGASQEEINMQEQEAKNAAEVVEGTDITCRRSEAEIVNGFNALKRGDFGGEVQFEEDESCTGSFFELNQ